MEPLTIDVPRGSEFLEKIENVLKDAFDLDGFKIVSFHADTRSIRLVLEERNPNEPR